MPNFFPGYCFALGLLCTLGKLYSLLCTLQPRSGPTFSYSLVLLDHVNPCKVGDLLDTACTLDHAYGNAGTIRLQICTLQPSGLDFGYSVVLREHVKAEVDISQFIAIGNIIIHIMLGIAK